MQIKLNRLENNIKLPSASINNYFLVHRKFNWYTHGQFQSYQNIQNIQVSLRMSS